MGGSKPHVLVVGIRTLSPFPLHCANIPGNVHGYQVLLNISICPFDVLNNLNVISTFFLVS